MKEKYNLIISKRLIRLKKHYIFLVAFIVVLVSGVVYYQKFKVANATINYNSTTDTYQISCTNYVNNVGTYYIVNNIGQDNSQSTVGFDLTGKNVEILTPLSSSYTCKVVVYGHQTFNNLILNNRTIITHEELSMISGSTTRSQDFYTAADVTPDHPIWSLKTSSSVTGVNKIVDLNISGTLTLNAGSSIDVTGKGYPGGINSGDGMKGYGPGGSPYYYTTQNHHAGSGGASYGGVGGLGADTEVSGLYCNESNINNYNIPAGVTYGDSTTTETLYHGSGSGSVKHSGQGDSLPGNPGGGLIKIVTGTLVLNGGKIIANGTDKSGTSGDIGAGGGSGGSIYLQFSQLGNNPADLNESVIIGPTVAAGNSFCQYATGKAGSIQWFGFADYKMKSNYTPGEENISARGGNSTNMGTPSGSGGGGRVIIVKTNTTPIINKTVKNLSRATDTSRIFKPGDEVEVKLEVLGVPTTQKFTLTDNIFSDMGDTGLILSNFAFIENSCSSACNYDSVLKTVSWPDVYTTVSSSGSSASLTKTYRLKVQETEQ